MRLQALEFRFPSKPALLAQKLLVHLVRRLGHTLLSVRAVEGLVNKYFLAMNQPTVAWLGYVPLRNYLRYP